MGGCTITRVADTLDSLFSQMEEQIMSAERLGLGVDSELIVIDPEKHESMIFKVILEYEETIPSTYPKSVKFEQAKKGRMFHVGVAANFGPKPTAGQLVGTIHVHT